MINNLESRKYSAEILKLIAVACVYPFCNICFRILTKREIVLDWYLLVQVLLALVLVFVSYNLVNMGYNRIRSEEEGVPKE
mgnify:CR=1 FL=1